MIDKTALVRVDGRARAEDVKILKAANINISELIRNAVAKAAKKLKAH